jgi:hypothetical protein
LPVTLRIFFELCLALGPDGNDVHAIKVEIFGWPVNGSLIFDVDDGVFAGFDL